MGIGKRKKAEEQPKPEPVKVPSRGVLLNKWAARQDKLQKLVAQVAKVKEELVEVAQLLHENYDVLVQDTTHTVTLPPKPTASVEPAPGEEGAVESLPLDRNPLAKSPIPIAIGEPTTSPMSESEVEKIRQGAQLEGGGSEQDVAQIAAANLDRIVRQGFGK